MEIERQALLQNLIYVTLSFLESRVNKHEGMEEDEKKQRELRPSVNDPGMLRVNWERVKCMNLIALAPEESRRDTGAVEKKP